MLNTEMNAAIARAEDALQQARDGRHVDLASFDADVTRICDHARKADIADRATAAVGLQQLDSVLSELENVLRQQHGDYLRVAAR